MIDRDYTRFRDCLVGCWQAISHGRDIPSKVVLDTFWMAFSGVSIDAFERAIGRHLTDPKNGEFLPRPASIVRALQGFVADDGRPCADEAWGIAAQCADEAATVVLTLEIRAAWAACAAIVESGDKVGARKTFMAIYDRLVAVARERGEPVVWECSLGRNADLRVAAVEQAARLNRISSAQALAVIAMARPLSLPSATVGQTAGSADPVAGLLAYVAEKTDEDGLLRLAEIKRMLAERRAVRLAEEQAKHDAALASSAQRVAAWVELRGGADAVAVAAQTVLSLGAGKKKVKRLRAVA
jgi:hypothetical protein